MAEHTRPSAETRAAEAEESRRGADAGRPPTAEEAGAADANVADPDVAAHEEEMARRGADQQGEGRLP